MEGKLLSTVAVPSGAAQAVPAGSVSLTAGQHGLLLRAVANADHASAATLNSIALTSIKN